MLLSGFLFITVLYKEIRKPFELLTFFLKVRLMVLSLLYHSVLWCTCPLLYFEDWLVLIPMMVVHSFFFVMHRSPFRFWGLFCAYSVVWMLAQIFLKTKYLDLLVHFCSIIRKPWFRILHTAQPCRKPI